MNPDVGSRFASRPRSILASIPARPLAHGAKGKGGEREIPHQHGGFAGQVIYKWWKVRSEDPGEYLSIIIMNKDETYSQSINGSLGFILIQWVSGCAATLQSVACSSQWVSPVTQELDDRLTVRQIPYERNPHQKALLSPSSQWQAAGQSNMKFDFGVSINEIYPDNGNF